VPQARLGSKNGVVSLTLLGVQGTTMTAADFRKVLKQNGFVDKNSKVTRRRSFTDYEYEVTTRRCLNIGNLCNIERQYGLGLNFIKPVTDGQMYCIFGKVVPRR
jgi:hypothetical protein